MTISASDLIIYGAASHAEDDSSAQGGAIDTSIKMAHTFMAVADTIEALSSAAGDTTQTLTITGRLVGGAIDTETIDLNGTAVVTASSPKTWERILKIEMDATATGTVTVRRADDEALATLEPGITEVRVLFYDAASSPSAAKTLYEKVFFRNENDTDTLSAAKVQLTLEPSAVADMLIALEDAVNDNNSSANRLTAPTGLEASGFVQSGVQVNVPGGSLGANAAIGVWIRMDLAQDNASFIDDWSLQLAGTTA